MSRRFRWLELRSVEVSFGLFRLAKVWRLRVSSVMSRYVGPGLVRRGNQTLRVMLRFGWVCRECSVGTVSLAGHGWGAGFGPSRHGAPHCEAVELSFVRLRWVTARCGLAVEVCYVRLGLSQGKAR